jgi:NitT/TauT family transport system substrate-binding protein
VKRWLISVLFVVGCGGDTATKTNTVSTTAGGPPPTFILAYSEYPSWSLFGAAEARGLIDGAEGKQGPLEKKYNIDLVLKLTDYDTSLTMFGNSSCDAVCVTNMDAIPLVSSRPAKAVLATSTSVGADACLGIGYTRPEEPGEQGGEAKKVAAFLKANPTYGLEKSVSEYCFYRCLQKLNLKPDDYKFVNLDPAVAAQAMQQGEKKSVMVWNPFVLQTLRTQAKAKRVFDSSMIPGEIVDMVVVGQNSLKKESGERGVRCVVETYYEFCKLMESGGDEVYVQLGEKFSSLNAADMRQCCKETKFFSKPALGAAVFPSAEFKKALDTILEFQLAKGYVTKRPAFTASDLEFDPKFMVEAGK